MENFKAFLKKDIEISAKRYGIDALGAMAQGLFASLLIGTIIATIGEQAGLKFLVEIGTYAKAATGPAMAIAIGYALHCPPLVLFSLAAVGAATIRFMQAFDSPIASRWCRRASRGTDCYHLCIRTWQAGLKRNKN